MSESNSILAADFGSVHTRVVLIDGVDGMYRLVARAIVRTTGGFPAGDVTLGLRAAVKQIEGITGRTLLDPSGTIITPEGINRQGVDYFLATASGGRSLRAVLVGLMPDVSLESARNAVEGNYIEVVDTLSLRDERSEAERLNAILLNAPDLIFITGGTDGGAVGPLWEVLDVVKLGIQSIPEGNRPIVIYAGNYSAVPRVREEFQELTTLLIADNVRPTLDEEYLRSAQLRIGQAFDAYKGSQGSGFDRVGQMSPVGVLPTAQSYRTVARFLGVADETIDTLAVVDIGSASSILSTFHKDNADDTRSNIRTDIGLGHSAESLIQAVPIERFRRWIPFSIAEADLMNYALNKGLRPGSIPINRREMYLEHALLRVAVETMLFNQRPSWRTAPPDLDQIIAAGSGFAATGNPALSAMLLADAIQPRGITELYLDPNALVAAMGSIGYVVPEAVVQLTHGDNLDFIGTLFSLEGSPTYGKTVGKYRVDYDDGDYSEGVIEGGGIYVLELAAGKTATVRIHGLQRGLRIGGSRRLRRKVRGSAGGIIIDARGRPLPLETSLEKRSVLLTVWYEFVTGIEHPTPTDDQLMPPVERIAPDELVLTTAGDDQEAAKPNRRGLFGRRGKQRDKAVDEMSVDELLEAADNAEDELDAMSKDMDLDDLRL